MMVVGTLAWIFVIGLYLGLIAAAVVAAMAMTLARRGRAALCAWGLVGWLSSSPLLLILLYVPMDWSGSINGGTFAPFEKPRIVEDLGLASLMAYGVTSPLLLAPLFLAVRSRLRARTPPSIQQAAT